MKTGLNRYLHRCFIAQDRKTDKQMELIIFFTNKNKLGVVGVDFPNTLNDTNRNQSYQYQFSNDKVVWVVNDGIDDTSMKNLLNAKTGISSVYYVYHNLPADTVKQAIKDYCTNQKISLIPQKDIHEHGKSKLYHLIGEFCQSNAELKVEFFDELKSKFSYDEELEKRLTLLHDCLHHESAAKADVSWLNTPQQDLVKKLVKINDNLHPDYIKTLTQLRKDLLGS